jgi:hypothetical protein
MQVHFETVQSSQQNPISGLSFQQHIACSHKQTNHARKLGNINYQQLNTDFTQRNIEK